MVKIVGKVQHYDWGGYTYIPGLLQISNTSSKPHAEYWMGTHHRAPAMVMNGQEDFPLSNVTTLSFLLKVLDVKDMLSIQVHPDKHAAEIEFARENNERIPIDAPNRNYKDDNHKPELLVALNEFWLLHGFKPETELEKILSVVPEFEALHKMFIESGYEELYKTVMGMPQETVDEILKPLIDRIVPLYHAGILQKNEEDHWAAKAALTFGKERNIDRGIFSIYFFNVVKLNRGEGLFQAAGLPHAYLEGQCVEIMSNSDNVLRGGLTTKHIDVKELMKHVRCEATVPDIQVASANAKEFSYHVPVPDFNLTRYEFAQNEVRPLDISDTTILLVIEGEAEFISEEQTLTLRKGESAAFLHRGNVQMKAQQFTEVYKASGSL